MIAKIKTFSSEVAKEMKKVSWPTKEQLRESSMVVVVTTLVFTAYTYGVDWIMAQLMDVIF